VPTLTASFSGFVNGDTASSLTKPPQLSTPATPASAPGSYPITVAGATSPNYTIQYVNGTLTVILPPATVRNVSIQMFKTGKRRRTRVIVLKFSEALNAADASSLSSYSLVILPRSRRRHPKPVALSQATYSPATFTATLFTRKRLTMRRPMQLTINSNYLRDALGRPLDGNYSGQPGANFVATLTKQGATVTSARTVSAAPLAAHAVDALLASGFRAGRRHP
jgi:hypothetical protein